MNDHKRPTSSVRPEMKSIVKRLHHGSSKSGFISKEFHDLDHPNVKTSDIPFEVTYMCDKHGHLVIGSDSWGFIVNKKGQLVRAALPIHLIAQDENGYICLPHFVFEKRPDHVCETTSKSLSYDVPSYETPSMPESMQQIVDPKIGISEDAANN